MKTEPENKSFGKPIHHLHPLMPLFHILLGSGSSHYRPKAVTTCTINLPPIRQGARIPKGSNWLAKALNISHRVVIPFNFCVHDTRRRSFSPSQTRPSAFDAGISCVPISISLRLGQRSSFGTSDKTDLEMLLATHLRNLNPLLLNNVWRFRNPQCSSLGFVLKYWKH